MSDFERAVEIAAEHTRDRETEQAHSCDGVNCGPVECEAEAYADTLGRLHEAYVFDGMTMLFAYPHSGFAGQSPALQLCVSTEYFNEHFDSRPDVVRKPDPSTLSIEKFIMHSGVKIYCLEDAVFKVVA